MYVREKPRFRIEVLASTYPVEEWMPLQHESGKKFRFVQQYDAQTAIDRLKRVQPHMVLRIARM